jgi:hypothetical protein
MSGRDGETPRAPAHDAAGPDAVPAIEAAGRQLRAPWAASVAGLLFSVMFTAALVLVRSESGQTAKGMAVVIGGLYLAPFAGIMFLWFVAVIRDQIGEREDRFFATVFFGSGLLFLAMLFAAGAVIGAILLVFAAEPNAVLNSTTLHIARALAYNLMNVYAIKMAGVFMISTSTVTIYTGMAPRWMALLGFALALTLLIGSYYIAWSVVVLPLWVLLISVHILIDNLRGTAAAVAERTGG